ncbi:CARDB domain-containing protein [Natranaerobius trueperi]|uniref:CARDB domain-containing protein n=1 Tax=Natranaerobius trueperi TaxID=759412 RepID=A0A226BWK9_9FIRM|nr:CARDB domain-containing protein [Natranaerobius trueperi]OWZ83393.1 hypothetical protein CDO51_08815 [Natranaerobius trueperi]
MLKTLAMLALITTFSTGTALAQGPPEHAGPPDHAGPNRQVEEKEVEETEEEKEVESENEEEEKESSKSKGRPDHAGQPGPPDHAGEQGPPEHASVPDKVREMFENREKRQGPPAHAAVTDFVREAIFGEDLEEDEKEIEVEIDDIKVNQETFEVEYDVSNFDGETILVVMNEENDDEGVVKHISSEGTKEIEVSDIDEISEEDTIVASIYEVLEDEDDFKELATTNTSVEAKTAELEVSNDWKDVLTNEVVGYDYSELDITIEETNGVDAEDVTVTSSVYSKDSDEAVFNEEKTFDSISEKKELSFDLKRFTTPNTYLSLLTIEADNADTIEKDHEFVVEENTFSVDIKDATESVTVGEEIEIEATVENDGYVEGRQIVELLDVNDNILDIEVFSDLEANEKETVVFSLETDEDDKGTHTFLVSTDDETEEVEVVVEEKEDDEE